MPAGDAQRVWFPEMIERLRAEWHIGMSLSDLIMLCDALDSMLQTIRSSRGIHPPLFTCPGCGRTQPGAEPKVSVRAMILSLARFQIVEGEHVKKLEREWTVYRRQKQLDLYGKAIAPESSKNVCAVTKASATATQNSQALLRSFPYHFVDVWGRSDLPSSP